MIFSGLNNQVMLEVQGVPSLIAEMEVRMATIEWCAQTESWKEDLEGVVITADTALVEISPDTGVIHRFSYVGIDGVPLEPSQPIRKSAAGKPTHYWVRNTGEIKVWKVPAVDTDIEIEAVLKPKVTDRSAPDFIFDRDADAIVHGAVARLKRQKDTSWMDMSGSAAHYAEFTNAAHKAKRRNKNLSGVRMEVKPREYGF
jgi:hypothetical protein